MSKNIELNIFVKGSNIIQTYFVLISVFFIFMILSDNIAGFRDPLCLNTHTFPITAGTSLLIHSDWYHFFNNMFLVILLAPVMIILFGVRKSILLLFTIGYLGHIVALLMVTMINFILILIHPLILSNLGYDPFNGNFFVTLRGAGISGGLSGWIGIIIYQWVRFLRNQDSQDNNVVYYFYWIILIASILVLSVTDIFNFLGYYSPFFFMVIPGNFNIKFPISRGNPFLGHLICLTIGYMIYNKWIKMRFTLIYNKYFVNGYLRA